MEEMSRALGADTNQGCTAGTGTATPYPEARAPASTHCPVWEPQRGRRWHCPSATPASDCACDSVPLLRRDGAAGLCAALMRSEHLESNFSLSILRVISHADTQAPDFHTKKQNLLLTSDLAIWQDPFRPEEIIPKGLEAKQQSSRRTHDPPS